MKIPRGEASLICAAYQRGESKDDLARKYGVKPETIRGILSRFRIRPAFVCDTCGKPSSRAWGCSTSCLPCAAERAPRRTQAIAIVAAAVRRGELPPAKSLTCVDCGAQAHDYDHRDYNQPLAVEPVCRSCNKRRGPALPLIRPTAEAIS